MRTPVGSTTKDYQINSDGTVDFGDTPVTMGVYVQTHNALSSVPESRRDSIGIPSTHLETNALRTDPRVIKPIDERLKELAELPEGWDSGEGIPVKPIVIRTARALCVATIGWACRVKMFPCADGTLNLSFFKGDVFVEVEIDEDGAFDVYKEKGKGDKCELLNHIPNATIEELNDELVESIWS